ncbi:MAG: hypothetical protein LBO21_04180 [Synergistaceae bacterium]|jgi:ABC-type proline/glycine betaine transport system permease subunit|nr:hypothetical protein [Synergistaceae bacterium]
MIRLRSAFIVTLIAVVLAFAVGVQVGYLTSRVSKLGSGVERWANEVKLDITRIKEADTIP